MDYTAWKSNFRYPTFRPGQETALEATAKQLEAGTKFIIAELPTGLGKSDIAMALAKTCPEKAFITTSQNVLIKQYLDDFGNEPDFHFIKGKTHYECRSDRYDNCGEGGDNKCPYFKSHGKEDGDFCTYKRERDNAIAAKIALTNNTYYALACRNAMLWEQRELAVLDEAHNLPGEILKLTSLVIDDKKLGDLKLAIRVPRELCTGSTRSELVELDPFSDYLSELLEEVELVLEQVEEDYAFSSKEKGKLEDIAGRIRWFQKSLVENVRWIVEHEFRGRDILTARPIDTGYFAQNMLFKNQARQFILQSATIVDFARYAGELGIDKSEAYKIVRPSPFPPERSPLYVMSVGNMSYKTMTASQPEIARTVEAIINSRPGLKGIVHTHKYEGIQDYLERHFAGNPRCKFPIPSEREETVNELFESDEPSVIFSPSLTEGVDGKGSRVRFQIMCKVPYPSLGDRLVKAKANEDWGWYSYQTLKTLVQSKGRGMRGTEDWCENFMLDSQFEIFKKQVEKSLPVDFKAALRTAEDGWKTIEQPETFISSMTAK